MVNLTELAVCAVMCFFLATQDGVLSPFGMKRGLHFKFLVFLPASVEVRRVVYQVHFLEITQNFKFHTVAEMMPWSTTAGIVRKELNKKGSVQFAYFESNSYVGSRLDRDLPFGSNSCPTPDDLEKEVSHYLEALATGSNTAADPVICIVGEAPTSLSSGAGCFYLRRYAAFSGCCVCCRYCLFSSAICG